MFKIFQVVKDGIATNFKFSSAASCMDQMRLMKMNSPESVITFLEIDL